MSELPSNLTPVRDAHVFDEGRLTDYLTAHVDGCRGPLRVLQFEGGQSNPTGKILKRELRKPYWGDRVRQVN